MVDGILSLAPDFRYGSPNNIVQKMHTTGLIKEPVFSFLISKNNSETTKLVIGDNAHSETTEPTRRLSFNSTLNSYWGFKADAIQLVRNTTERFVERPMNMIFSVDDNTLFMTSELH